MTETPYVTRRATVEDLPQLIALWQLERLPAEALEKRFTEFQVVCDDAGLMLAALGLQIAGAQGLLHGESIARPELSDALRDLLWKRLQVLIHNHALERLWTQLPSHYWRERGFERVAAEALEKLPPAFGRPDTGTVALSPSPQVSLSSRGREWQMMALRAASATAALEREFAEIKTLQQQETARLQQRVQWMKRVALGVTVAVFLLVVAWAVVLLKYGPKFFRAH